ncbi:MAG: electron transfer flavoprotein subunit beta/FixA family protein [Candidatus Riflemargulisbacteria bacterium]
MNIAVCIKQVPDSDKVTIDRETNRLNRAGVPSVINPFDENALELGLQLKDKYGGKVTVITMGPPQAEEALRECVSVGADEVILVTDRKFAGSDTWATSYTLSLAVQKAGDFDVVLFGKQAIDGDTAQVGPGVAYFMDIPVITYVKEAEKTDTGFKVKRVTEEGYQLWEVDGKAAFTVVKEANTMRLPSLKGKMRAKSATIITWGADDLGAEDAKIGLKGSPTIVKKVFSPPIKTNRETIQNEDPKQSVKELLGKLKERKLI